MKNLKKLAVVTIFLLIADYAPAMESSDMFHSLPTTDVIYGGAYLTFAGKFGGEISKTDLGKYQKLGVEGCAKGSTITQFTITLVSGDKTLVFSNRSDVLDKKILNALKQLKKGDVFTFKNVKAKLPSGDMVDVHCREFVMV